jgi:guanylate kinase
MDTENSTDNQNKANNQNLNKDFSIDNLLKITVMVSIFLFSFSIFFRYIFYLPNREKIKEQKLEECLSDAKERYKKRWEEKCEEFKEKCMNDKEHYNLWNDECREALKEGKCRRLPGGSSLNERFKEYKEECFKKYK